MKKPNIPPANEKQVRNLLQKYNCPVPYHQVRTLFLGNIATPATASPVQIVKSLWGGELPPFDSMDALNDLIGALINGLWNALTRHQKRTAPFKLNRPTVEQTQAGLAAFTLVRFQEIDGFIDGLFNGQEELQLPETALESVDTLGELRAMLVSAHALAIDYTKSGSDNDFAKTLKLVQELTPIIEHEINSVVLACTRARRQMMQTPDFTKSTLH